MEHLLAELQSAAITCAGAAVTAFVIYLINALRTFFGIEKSDANEEAIRRAAATEAGKLLQTGAIADPDRIAEAAAKVIVDLHSQVKDEGYNSVDIKDMIIGAAGIVFPPANLLKLFIK